MHAETKKNTARAELIVRKKFAHGQSPNNTLYSIFTRTKLRILRTYLRAQFYTVYAKSVSRERLNLSQFNSFIPRSCIGSLWTGYFHVCLCRMKMRFAIVQSRFSLRSSSIRFLASCQMVHSIIRAPFWAMWHRYDNIAESLVSMSLSLQPQRMRTWCCLFRETQRKVGSPYCYHIKMRAKNWWVFTVGSFQRGDDWCHPQLGALRDFWDYGKRNLAKHLTVLTENAWSPSISTTWRLPAPQTQCAQTQRHITLSVL